MIDQLNRYLRMVKFSHTIFALPFAGIAFVQALGRTELIQNGVLTESFYMVLIKITLAMVSLRSAAMGFNRIADRNYDAQNPRTSSREIPAGTVSLQKAKLFVIFFTMVFVISAFWLNELAGLLSPVAIFIVFGYSYTKRFTMFTHFILGMGIGLAPTATWIAMTESIEWLPVLWSIGLALYIAGFDILYSCQDADFDRDMGLFSLPARMGITPSLWIARIAHVVALLFFIWAGTISHTGWVFVGAVSLAGVLFAIEHMMVRPHKLDRIPIAFFHINASISTILFLGLLLDLYVA